MGRRKRIKIESLPEHYNNSLNERCNIVNRGQRCFLIVNLDSELPYQVIRRKIRNGAEILTPDQVITGFARREPADQYFVNIESGEITPPGYTPI